MTTNQTRRKFTPQAILARACTYGMCIFLENDHLIVETPSEMESTTRDRALQVISERREEIIAHISQENKRSQREVDEYLASNPPLCYTCLNAGNETPALSDDYAGLMYCVNHHPNHKPIESAG